MGWAIQRHYSRIHNLVREKNKPHYCFFNGRIYVSSQLELLYKLPYKSISEIQTALRDFTNSLKD